MDESQRPGLVVFVIVTDGEENSSHEFNLPQIREMIQRQQSDYGWQFTFLGANQDAFSEAAAMGIQTTSAALYSAENSDKAFAAAASNVSRMRTARSANAQVDCSYTDAERKAMS